MSRQARETRKERVPVGGTRDILAVKDKDPNYEYRWVNDVPGRIQRHKDGGWEPVTDDLDVGQAAVDQRPDAKLGSVITKHVGSNITAVLMRIPKEWYDEDQAAKQANVDAIEQSTMDQADEIVSSSDSRRDPRPTISRRR